jgi:hypothetical protein
MAMSNRTPREQETRLNVERKKAWSPPSLLPRVKEDPNYGYRWLRKTLGGKQDDQNMLSKQEEGWELVERAEHPELQTSGRTSGTVETGGLVLAKMPKEFVDQRNEYYRNFTEAQTAAVDSNLMKENDPRMPLFSDRKSTTTRGTRG